MDHRGYSADDPDRSEAARLTGVFAEAKARIEAMRAGRTYVAVIDWMDTAGTGTPSWGQAGSMFHLPAPTISSIGYLGTDFLHIYAGEPIANRGGGIITDESSNSDLTGLTAHSSSVSRVNNASGWFARYAAKLYTPDLAVPVLPLYPTTPNLIGPYYNWPYPVNDPPYDSDDSTDYGLSPEYLDSIRFATDPPGPTFEEAVEEGFTLAQAAYAAGVVFANAPMVVAQSALDARYPGAVAAMAQSAATLPNVASVDGTTSDLTADSLVSLIAAHYGFDPETGADL